MAAQNAAQRAAWGAIRAELPWRATSCLLAGTLVPGSKSDSVLCMPEEAGLDFSSGTQVQCRTSEQSPKSLSSTEAPSAGSPAKALLESVSVSCMHFFQLLSPIAPASSFFQKPADGQALTSQASESTKPSNVGVPVVFRKFKNQIDPPMLSHSLLQHHATLSASLQTYGGFALQPPLYSHSSSQIPFNHAPFSTQAATPASFPSRIEDFSTSWLTDVLRKSGAIGADSAVQSFSSERVGKNIGLVSALYSVRVTYIGAPGSHAPSALVAKFAHPSEEARAFAVRNGSYEREARFYQTFGTRPAGTPATVNRHKVPIRTPEIYFCEYEPESERLCILMQDVSDFEPLDQIRGATFDEALGVMQDIGRFHALCWNSPDLDTWSWLPQLHEPRFLAFDPQEYRTAWPRALKLFPGLIPEHLLSPLSQLPEAAPKLLERLGGSPRALLHGDLRLDNVYIRRGKADADKVAPLAAGVTQDPNLLFIDFGDCCAGRGAHDVGYFLSQSLEPGVRREHEKKLLHAYWGALHGSDADDVGDMQERLAGYDFEDLVQDYKLGVLYNFCLAVNMANLIEEGKGGERVRLLARTAIDRAVKTIEDHNLGELLLEHVS